MCPCVCQLIFYQGEKIRGHNKQKKNSNKEIYFSKYAICNSSSCVKVTTRANISSKLSNATLHIQQSHQELYICNEMNRQLKAKIFKGVWRYLKVLLFISWFRKPYQLQTKGKTCYFLWIKLNRIENINWWDDFDVWINYDIHLIPKWPPL